MVFGLNKPKSRFGGDAGKKFEPPDTACDGVE